MKLQIPSCACGVNKQLDKGVKEGEGGYEGRRERNRARGKGRLESREEKGGKEEDEEKKGARVHSGRWQQ